MVVTIAESGQLSETAPIVDSSLVESNVMKDSLRIWAESLFGGSDSDSAPTLSIE
jgi:hypothetical protein